MTFPPSLEDIDDWDALEAGGSGGNWWETTATGAVTISPSAQVQALAVGGPIAVGNNADYDAGIQVDGEGIFEVYKIQAGDDIILRVGTGADTRGLVTIESTGAVTITPNDDVTALYVQTLPGSTVAVAQIFNSDAQGLEITETTGYLAASDSIEFAVGDFDSILQMTSVLGERRIGFFAATPAAKPTGVAVNAAGIHAALVTLGLIAA